MVRRREVELMTDLIDILPRIENLDESWVGQVRDAMFHADHPYMMVFVGPFNSGKSSLINALVGRADLLKIGPTPVTDEIAILRYGDDSQPMPATGAVRTVFSPSPLLRKVSFVDTPGLESVFREHEETTNRFLHRADIILLVMLATQAMTQSNLETLQRFRQYGKKVIIVINQSDLLSDEERETVRKYVTEQSKDKLGFTPEVWMVSARWGQEAWQPDGSRDAVFWANSGLGQIEHFVEQQLNDVNRLRQKLQTPLQIAQNAHQVAVETVKQNQRAYDQYRNVTENVERQLEQQRSDLRRIVREVNSDVEARFALAIARASEAMHELFNPASFLRLTAAGIAELTFIGALLRRGRTPDTVATAFQRHKVEEPLRELALVSDKMAPRLEGQDIKDVADLVSYSQREVDKMPREMRANMIGTIAAPSTYDRSATLGLRAALEPLETQAVALTAWVEQARRNTIIYLALWQVVCALLFVGLLALWGSIAVTNDAPIEFVLLAALIVASLLGFAMIPLRGRMIHRAYANRLYALQAQYTEALTRASDAQIEQGMKMRQEAIAPLTRLIESQATLQTKQLALLNNAEQQVARLESELNALGKRKILGLAI